MKNTTHIKEQTIIHNTTQQHPTPKSKIDLKTDSIPRLFFYYFIPALLAMLALSTYSTVDGIFVGKKIGENGLAAIGICWPIFPAFIAYELLFGFGGAAIVGYFLGKDHGYRARLVFCSIFYFVAISSVFIGIVGFCFADSIITALTADKPISSEIKELASSYIRIIFIGTPMLILHPLCDIFVINDKRPILASIAMIVGSASNIALNYIFLFVCDMGIEGSALATVSAHTIGFIVLVSHFFLRKGKLFFIPRFSFAAILSSSKSGIPESVSELSAAVVMLLFNVTLIQIAGDEGVKIYSIMMYCGIVFFTILLSVSQALQPIASFNYGAGNFARLKKAFVFACFMVVSIGLCIYALFYGFDRHLVELFLQKESQDFANVSNNALLEKTINAMNVYYAGYVIFGINIVCAIFLQSVQRTLSSFIITICYTILFLVVLLPTLSHIYGIDGAWASYPLSQACAFVVAFVVMCYEWRYGIFSGSIPSGATLWKRRKNYA
ncbi:MATE family efflux transporter [Helicobacter sp. T3_23-1059]